MALSEADIVRYSRQILLKDVGGVGQQRLLAFGVRLRGEGSALSTAAAYLAASGVGVEPQHRPVTPAERGFLAASSDVDEPGGAALRAGLLDLNPGAVGRPATGVLGELPAAFPGDPPHVCIGWAGKDGAVLFRAAGGCEACFLATAAGLSNGPAGASSVALGALAALVVQRLALGWEDRALAGLALKPSGIIEELELARCADHQAR